MGMVIDELIPLCQTQGLGRAPAPIGIMGISMGGYGALLMAEKHPRSSPPWPPSLPAVWTTYAEAEGANAGAYTSASDFAANDAVTHAGALAHTPVRIASGSRIPSTQASWLWCGSLPFGPWWTSPRAATRVRSSGLRNHLRWPSWPTA
jgi:S-formylglutathione hydrolase FrmB